MVCSFFCNCEADLDMIYAMEVANNLDIRTVTSDVLWFVFFQEIWEQDGRIIFRPTLGLNVLLQLP